jgi:hypothetical protein
MQQLLTGCPIKRVVITRGGEGVAPSAVTLCSCPTSYNGTGDGQLHSGSQQFILCEPRVCQQSTVHSTTLCPVVLLLPGTCRAA